VMNGAGGAQQTQQPQPAAAGPTEEGDGAAPAQQQDGAGGPFGRILNMLSSLVDRLNLPANEKDALKTVVSLLGRLLGGAGGEQPQVPQAA
jgi:hypothetical protein